MFCYYYFYDSQKLAVDGYGSLHAKAFAVGKENKMPSVALVFVMSLVLFFILRTDLLQTFFLYLLLLL